MGKLARHGGVAVQRIFETISDVASPMTLFLMLAAGLLGRYWDGPVFEYKHQHADASTARGVGLSLIIGAGVLYAVKLAARFIVH